MVSNTLGNVNKWCPTFLGIFLMFCKTKGNWKTWTLIKLWIFHQIWFQLIVNTLRLDVLVASGLWTMCTSGAFLEKKKCCWYKSTPQITGIYGKWKRILHIFVNFMTSICKFWPLRELEHQTESNCNGAEKYICMNGRKL